MLKRLVIIVPLLIGITMMTFLLLKAVPGDPVFSMVGERANPETIEMIRKEMGADRGIFHQYNGYISLLLRGELGRSYFTNRKVLDDIAIKLPHTLLLAVFAMALAGCLGILFGVLSALHPNRSIRRTITLLSLAGLSVPVFWSGLMLMIFFSLWLRLLPPSGTGEIRYLILPALTLSLPAAATIARITRFTVVDIAAMPFIGTARAKGLDELHITFVHIMRNALIPVVTVIGLDFGSYLNGAVLTETIFGWDGIGRFMMEAIVKRDYPVIMGCLLTGTTLFILINVFVDIAYHFIDPRVRLDASDR